MRRLITAVAIAGAGALALAGCTTGGSAAPTTAAASGGTITVAQTNEVTSFNSNTAQGNLDVNGMVSYLTGTASGSGLGGFYYLDDKFNVTPNPSIGTYEKTSDDPLTVKYTLNKDAKWSDGTPLTSDDMVYAWAAASGYYNDGTTDADGNVTSGTDYFSLAGSTEGINYTAFPTIDDAQTVTLVYSKPYVDWQLVDLVDKPAHVAAKAAGLADAAALTAALKAAPKGDPAKPVAVNPVIKAIADQYNTGYDATSLPSNPDLLLSSGPYIVTAWNPSQSMTLSKNPNYTGSLTSKVDNLVIRFIGDTNAQVSALQNGEVDAIQPQASADTITALKAANATLLQGDQLAYDHLDLNFASPVFSDLKVRQAFLKTIPRQQILDSIVTPVNPDAKVLNSQIWVPANEPYADSVANNGSSAYADVDIAGAKALLAGATPTVRILYNTKNPNRVDEFKAIQASAAQAGFNVTDSGSPDWSSLLPGGDYDASIFGWASPGVGSAVIPQLFSATSDGNYNKYTNAEINQLALDTQTMTDPNEVIAAEKKIDAATFADAYGLPLFQSPGVFATNAKVDGIKYFGGQTGIFWNAFEWSVK